MAILAMGKRIRIDSDGQEGSRRKRRKNLPLKRENMIGPSNKRQMNSPRTKLTKTVRIKQAESQPTGKANEENPH